MYFRHVQINNETALDFYKKFGFNVVEVVQNYYKRIEPADAYVLEKNVKGQGNLTKSNPDQKAGTHLNENTEKACKVANDCYKENLSSDKTDAG